MDDLDLGKTITGFSAGQKVFARYKLRRLLGRGGMGVVWLARDERLETDVALKFLPELVAHDPAAIHDLKRETRRSLQLTHPHIVRIYDFVQDERVAAVAMEWVDGATLTESRLNQTNGVFECEALEDWVRELCAALGYAHEAAKIVHRDLKPANVMVDGGGRIKITDFGIAASLSESATRVSQVGTSGTLVYMSPQQMMGEPPAASDDIYALGAMLYELLTGKPPFYSGDVATQVRTVRPMAIAERRRQLGVEGGVVPEKWERVVAACLAKEPAARPVSARRVAEYLCDDVPLEEVAEQRVSAGPKETAPERSPSQMSRAWLMWAGGVIAVGVVAVVIFFRPAPSASPATVVPAEVSAKAEVNVPPAAAPFVPPSQIPAVDFGPVEAKLATLAAAIQPLREAENPFLRRRIADLDALSRRGAEHKAAKSFDAALGVFQELEKNYGEVAGFEPMWRRAEAKQAEWLRHLTGSTLVGSTQREKLDERSALAARDLAAGKFAEAEKCWAELEQELGQIEAKEKARLTAEEQKRLQLELEKKREEAVLRWVEKFDREPVVKITVSPTGYPQGMKIGGMLVGNSQSTNGWERMSNSFDKTFSDRMGRSLTFSWTSLFNGNITRGGFSGGGRTGTDRYTVNFNGVEQSREFTTKEWKFDAVVGWLKGLTFGDYKVRVEGRRLQYALEIDFQIYQAVGSEERQAIREKKHPQIADADYGF